METVVDVKFPDFSHAATQLRDGIPGLIASVLQRQRAMIFMNEGAYHGRLKWEPLKCRTGQILFDTGKLSQSIGPANRTATKPGSTTGTIVRLLDGIVTIGTSLDYAAVHDEGMEIRAQKAKALRFKCHDDIIYRKKVKIPARPFSDFTAQDEKDLVGTVENYIGQTIGGAT